MDIEKGLEEGTVSVQRKGMTDQDWLAYHRKLEENASVIKFAPIGKPEQFPGTRAGRTETQHPVEPLDLTMKDGKGVESIRTELLLVSDNPKCDVQVIRDDYSDYNSITGYFECVCCCLKFDTRASLLLHYKDHVAPYQCINITYDFTNAADLEIPCCIDQNLEKQHSQCHWKRLEGGAHSITTNSARDVHQECGKSFCHIGNLQHHPTNHRDECLFRGETTLRSNPSDQLPFVCLICSRGFSQVGNLKRHMTRHRSEPCKERPYRCPHCGQSFAHESTLRNHFRTHTGEQPYRCTLCDRAFSQIGNLKRHMAKHASQQDFLCGSCGMSFVTSKELLRHQCPGRLEDGLSKDCRMITPWRASQASSKYYESWASSSSEAEGTDQAQRSRKRSVSDDDHSSSSSGSSVVQRKWKIFPCHVCGKVYTWQHDLKIHFRTHSGEKPYSCDLCGKTFAQSGAIRTHKRRHHPEACNISPSF